MSVLRKKPMLPRYEKLAPVIDDPGFFSPFDIAPLQTKSIATPVEKPPKRMTRG